MKVVIVGGVAGGMSAAARLRRLNEQAEIIVFEKGPYVSFANCGLPYYIGGEIKERSKLLVQTAKGLYDRFRIDVRTESEIVRIDRKNRKVAAVHNGKEYEENFDVLILSTGAKPFRPSIEGLDKAGNTFTLRNIPDTDRIVKFIEENHPKTAAIIGAGFIGLEMAENISRRGLQVSVIERGNQLLPPLDFEMAALVEEQLGANHLTVLKNKTVVSFEKEGTRLVLNDGSTLAADLVILSVGVQPESALAGACGLETGLRGAILVNDKFQTSDSNIYAIGDAIVVKQVVSGAPAVIPLASPANRQGRMVADIISGIERHYAGTLGTSIVRVFKTAAAVTGLNAKQLKATGTPYQTVHVQPVDHAGYYPNSKPLVLKLLFDPKDGKLFGAQAVGPNGADKRIDVLATAIKAGLSVYDLTELELAYAPPFGSAKDPVNMLGYAALNLLEGDVKSVQWNEVDELVEQGHLLVDVRNPGELARGFIRGAVNIPLDQLRDRLAELPKERDIIVSCQVGLRGYVAARILSQRGFCVKNLDGGFRLYAAALPERVQHR